MAHPPPGGQAVRRALDVLLCFRDGAPPLTASGIARRLGLSTSTAHRLAQTLAGAEFLTRDASARYLLGPAVTELGLLSFHRLSSGTDTTPDNTGKQALVLPDISYDQVQDLATGWGRLHGSAELLLAQLVSERNLDPAELRRMRELLDRRLGKKGKQ